MARLVEHLDVTQRDLADDLGVHPSLVSHSSSGRGLGRRVVLRICHSYMREMSELGIRAEDLLLGSRFSNMKRVKQAQKPTETR